VLNPDPVTVTVVVAVGLRKESVMNGESAITGPPVTVNCSESEALFPEAGVVASSTVIKYDPERVPDLTSNTPATVPSAASLQTGDNAGVPERVHEPADIPMKPEPDTDT
jgi:hypothetical protein